MQRYKIKDPKKVYIMTTNQIRVCIYRKPLGTKLRNRKPKYQYNQYRPILPLN